MIPDQRFRLLKELHTSLVWPGTGMEMSVGARRSCLLMDGVGLERTEKGRSEESRRA